MSDTPETDAGEIAVLQKLMAERGFRVSRGIYVHSNGERLPKWAIDRLDTPAWGGVWMFWELNAVPAEDGELQTLFRLCATALTKWDADAWMHDFEDERGEQGDNTMSNHHDTNEQPSNLKSP